MSRPENDDTSYGEPPFKGGDGMTAQGVMLTVGTLLIATGACETVLIDEASIPSICNNSVFLIGLLVNTAALWSISRHKID